MFTLFPLDSDGSALSGPLLAVSLAWLFAVGASIGSFLNVVVHRLPRGISLAYPPSRCPACGTPIAARDNLPIFGWLLLGGRCRNCRKPISSRYPLVELATALLFTGLGWLEPLGGGLNLPQAGGGSPELSVAPAGAAMFWGLYLTHLVLICTLGCAALIERDGGAIPRRLFLTAAIVGFLVPLVWPGIRPVPLGVHSGSVGAGGEWIAGLIEGLCGAFVGGALGAIVAVAHGSRQHRRNDRKTQTGADRLRHDEPRALAAVGLVLGWQAVIAVTVLVAAAEVARAILVRGKAMSLGWHATLATVTVAWVAGWRWYVAWWRDAGLASGGGARVAAVAAFAVVAVAILSWIARRSTSPSR